MSASPGMCVDCSSEDPAVPRSFYEGVGGWVLCVLTQSLCAVSGMSGFRSLSLSSVPCRGGGSGVCLHEVRWGCLFGITRLGGERRGAWVCQQFVVRRSLISVTHLSTTCSSSNSSYTLCFIRLLAQSWGLELRYSR